MHPVTLRLRRATGVGAGLQAESEPDDVISALRGAATDDDRVGHAYARATPDGVEVVLYVATARLETAERTAAALFERVAVTVLIGYELRSCQVELIPPIAEALIRLSGHPPCPDQERQDPDMRKA
jgi:hypothetical protein